MSTIEADLELAIVEALSDAIPCEYSNHDRVGSGHAAWYAIRAGDAPCGCPRSACQAFCDGCRRTYQRGLVLRCTRCGYVAPPSGTSLGADPMSGLTFTVEGKPAPQGSKRIGRNRATGAPILLDDNDADLRVWRGKVRDAAWQAMTATGFETIDGPCMVSLVFSFARPKGHYGTGRNADVLRPAAPLYPAVKPDADKLIRAALDSMTNAAVFYDDSRVVTLTATKTYGTPGLRVHVEPITEEQP